MWFCTWEGTRGCQMVFDEYENDVNPMLQYGLHSHLILTQLNTSGRLWTGVLQTVHYTTVTNPKMREYLLKEWRTHLSVEIQGLKSQRPLKLNTLQRHLMLFFPLICHPPVDIFSICKVYCLSTGIELNIRGNLSTG